MFAHFEVRRKDIAAARRILGQAIGRCPKDRIFQQYIQLELYLVNVDRCRTLYGASSVNLRDLRRADRVDVISCSINFVQVNIWSGHRTIVWRGPDMLKWKPRHRKWNGHVRYSSLQSTNRFAMFMQWNFTGPRFQRSTVADCVLMLCCSCWTCPSCFGRATSTLRSVRSNTAMHELCMSGCSNVRILLLVHVMSL